ncbi:hypothetical protein ACTZWW_21000 [Salinarimonas sp. NSM]|uniref:hypothetical protein n=1 Tax=Salinarimonas sp. NSM TaxID=3458003 RepID=UPI004034FBCE
MTFGSTALIPPGAIARRLAALAAAGLVAGTLAACSPYGPDASTGATTGAVVGGASAGVGPAPRGEVVCAFDPLYGRDVCYR